MIGRIPTLRLLIAQRRIKWIPIDWRRDLALLLRLLAALLSLHVATCLTIFLTGGFFFAGLLLTGIGYGFFPKVIVAAPLFQISFASAAFVFLWLLFRRSGTSQHSVVLIGTLPIVVFFIVGEVSSRTAMQLARNSLGAESCLFRGRLFAGSMLGTTARIRIFGAPRATRHHAHIALQDGTVLIWSYLEMNFMEVGPGSGSSQPIPPRCKF